MREGDGGGRQRSDDKAEPGSADKTMGEGHTEIFPSHERLFQTGAQPAGGVSYRSTETKTVLEGQQVTSVQADTEGFKGSPPRGVSRARRSHCGRSTKPAGGV